MMRRLLILVWLAVLGGALPALAQTGLAGRSLTIGSAPAPAAGTSVRLKDLGTSGGTYVLLGDASDGGNIRARVLGVADIPSPFTRDDIAETISQAWAFSAGITTPSVSTTSGPLTLAPAGQGLIAAGSRVFAPATPYSHHLGTKDAKWLTGWIADLHIDTIVAQEVMSTVGGRILVASTTELMEPRGAANTTFTFRHDSVADNDILYAEAEGRVEFFRVNGTPAAANLIPNNDFVAGSVTGWTSNGTGGTFAASALSYWHGAFGLRVSQTGSTQFYASTVTMSPSTTYTMCAYARKDSGAAVTGSDVQFWDGNAYAASTVTQEGQWYRPCRTFTTAGSLSDARPHVFWASAGAPWNFDAFSLEATSSVTPWAASKVVVQVVRDLDGSGANDWPAGTAIVNTGQTGAGFIDLYATRGVRAGTEIGPTICGNARLSSTYNDWAPRWCIGELDGKYGYSASTWGAAFGDPSGVWMGIDATNGVRGMDGSTQRLRIDPTGYLLLGDASSSNSNTYIDSTTVSLRRGTTMYASLTSSGLLLGRTGSGAGNMLADTSGNLALRSGTTNRILVGGSTGTIQMYDSSGVRQVYIGPNGSGGGDGIILGEIANDRVFAHIRNDALQFCRQSGCALTIAGATGDITSIGSLSIAGTATIGSSVAVGTSGNVRGGATAYASGTGFWIGNDSGTYKLRVGTTSGNRLTWDGSSLTVVGNGAGLIDLDGGNIQAGTITATEIAAGTITANEIATGTITADRLNVSTLSALSADLGTVTAGSISIGAGTTQTTIASNGQLTASGAVFDSSAEFQSGVLFNGPVVSIVNIEESVFRLGAFAGGGDRHLCVDNLGHVGPC